MNNKYFVQVDGENKGPFSVDEIQQLVGKEELSAESCYFDNEQEKWLSLLELEGVGEELRLESEEGVAQWYVLKENNKYGPFNYLELVRMLQEKTIFEFDYIWKNGLEKWERIALLEEFDPEAIRQLKGKAMPEMMDIFYRRRHPRAEFNERVLVHNNKRFWNARGVEISSGGAGLIMENATLTPGTILYMHFNPGEEVPAFNAICEIVSKEYVDGLEDEAASVRYGVKFTRLEKDVRQVIKDFAKRAFAKVA